MSTRSLTIILINLQSDLNNTLALRAAKTGLTIFEILNIKKTFSLYARAIFKSMRVADDPASHIQLA